MAKQKDGSYALKEYPTEKIWTKFSEKENSKRERERERVQGSMYDTIRILNI